MEYNNSAEIGAGNTNSRLTTKTTGGSSMAQKTLPTPEELRQLIWHSAPTGRMFWRPRARKWFANDGACKTWNRRFARHEAFIYRGPDGYFQGAVMSVNIKAHRVLWALEYGEWPDGQIDHINGDGFDNRIENLRVVTQAENNKNVKISSSNKSGVTGVCWHPSVARWMARVQINGRTKYLGLFDTIEEAAAARKKANKKFGFHPNHGLTAEERKEDRA